MSSTRSSSLISTVEPKLPQLARRRSGSPEQGWMARAAQHAAMIIRAAAYWEAPISTIIQDFGHRSLSRAASPSLPRPDTPIPLLIPLPKKSFILPSPFNQTVLPTFPPHQPNCHVPPPLTQSPNLSKRSSLKQKITPLLQLLPQPFHSPYMLALLSVTLPLHRITMRNPNLELTLDSYGTRTPWMEFLSFPSLLSPLKMTNIPPPFTASTWTTNIPPSP
jgi:hypothetical protein